MEELRSTDILDREILEDARKKVQRILESSIQEVEKIQESTKNRIQKILEEKKLFYTEKLARYEKDLKSSVPFERQRYAINFVMTSVRDAIKTYILDLQIQKKVQLIDRLLQRYAPVFADKKISVQYAGFDEQSVKKILNNYFSAKALIDCTKNDVTDFEGVIIESEDKKILCRATIQELIIEITDQYREELAHTLFKGRIPQ